MTPSGTRMRPTSRPLGRCHWLSMAPTGSGRPATCRQAARMSASTAGCRVRRSMRGASRPRARAASRSCALAVRSSASRSSSRAARRVRAAFLAAGLALASRRAASLAFWPSRVISCAKVIRAPWVGSSLYTLPQERGQGDGPLYGMSLYARISFFFWGKGAGAEGGCASGFRPTPSREEERPALGFPTAGRGFSLTEGRSLSYINRPHRDSSGDRGRSFCKEH